jgi:Kef-type K+ transport system membrane component KefB
MIRAAILLAMVYALALSARSFLPAGMEGGGGAILAFGFVLLAAIQTGHIFHALRLPHLTGFLLCGVVFGPEGPEFLRLLTPSMVHDLAVIKRVAIGLIALLAGCELNLQALRPRLKVVGTIAAFGLLFAGVLVWTFLFFLLPELTWSAGMTTGQRAVVALVGANVLIALSPAVVIGIVSETRSAGPVTEMALSLVVLADLVVVLTFSLTDSVAHAVFPVVGAAGGAASLAAHILGSLAVGAVLGAVMALFIARVGRKVGLFVFGVLFVIAEAGGQWHLDPLLVGLAAGLFLENVSAVSGHLVVHETESASLPTFAVFFATVGAEIHLRAFADVALWAVAAALLRALGQYAGLRVAVWRYKLEPSLWQRLYLGMLPQAGVAIALAILVATKFGAWGEQLAVLLFGTIVVNELIGPVLWRGALIRAGEVGRRESAPSAAGHARRASTAATSAGDLAALDERTPTPVPPGVTRP